MDKLIDTIRSAFLINVTSMMNLEHRLSEGDSHTLLNIIWFYLHEMSSKGWSMETRQYISALDNEMIGCWELKDTVFQGDEIF